MLVCACTGVTCSPRPARVDRGAEDQRGDVRADGRGDAELGLGVEVRPVELVESEDRRGRVGASTAEPGGDRDALVDGDRRAGRLPVRLVAQALAARSTSASPPARTSSPARGTATETPKPSEGSAVTTSCSSSGRITVSMSW